MFKLLWRLLSKVNIKPTGWFQSNFCGLLRKPEVDSKKRGLSNAITKETVGIRPGTGMMEFGLFKDFLILVWKTFVFAISIWLQI